MLRRLYPVLFSVAMVAFMLAPLLTVQAQGWLDQSVATIETLRSIRMFDGIHGMVVGDNGITYYTTNGQMWTLGATATGKDLHALSFGSSATVAFAVGDSGTIRKTTNGGISWSLLSAPVSGDIFGVDMVSDTLGWVVGSLGHVFKTTDGLAWSSQTSGVGKKLYDVEAISAQMAWFVGDFGLVSKTIDGGATWVAQTSGVTDALLAVEFVNAQVGYIAGENRTFLRTTNSGATWTPVVINAIVAGTSITDMTFFSQAEGVMVEANGQVLETSDSGLTWSVVSDTPMGIYASVDAVGADAAVAGGNGRLSRLDATAPSRPGGLTWATSSSDTTPTFTWTAATDTISEMDRYEVSFDAGATLIHVGTALSYTSIALADGDYTVWVRAIDAAENASAFALKNFTIDAVPEPEPEPEPPSSLAPGTRIKTACPGGEGVNHPCRAVYYYSAAGTRHVFSNAKVYFSWYENFDDVMIVNEATMASFAIGRNITYRPGIKMVKFQTLATVYVVERGGVLRPVNSEATAAALYGHNWNQQIDDISDAFFTNYSFGDPVSGLSDYNPAAAAFLTPTISVDLAG